MLAGEIKNRVAGHHQILLAAAGGQLLGREPKTFAHLADNGIHIHKRIVKAVLRQNFLRHFHGNGTAKQLGLEQQVMHAAFQLPDIPGEALGQHIHHRIGQQRVVLAGLLLKDAAARAGVGLFNTGEEPQQKRDTRLLSTFRSSQGAKELVRTTRLPFSCRDLMVESTSSCIFSLPWRKCTSSRSSKSTSRKRPLKRSTVLDWRACTKQLENSSAVRYSTLGLERLLASTEPAPRPA